MKGTMVSVISVLILFLDSSWICSAAYDVLGKIPKEYSTTDDWSKFEVTPFLDMSFKPNDFYNIKRERLLTFNDTELVKLKDIEKFPAKISQEIDNHIAASFTVSEATPALVSSKSLSYKLQLMHSLPHPKDWNNATFVKEFFHLPTFTFDEAQRAGMNMAFMYGTFKTSESLEWDELYESHFLEWLLLMISAPSTWSDSYIKSLTPKHLTTHIYKLLSGEQIIELEMDNVKIFLEDLDVIIPKIMAVSTLTSASTSNDVEDYINEKLTTLLQNNLMKEHLSGLKISTDIVKMLKDSLELRAKKQYMLSGEEVYTKVRDYLRSNMSDSTDAPHIFDKIPRTELEKINTTDVFGFLSAYLTVFNETVPPWVLNKMIHFSSRVLDVYGHEVSKVLPDNMIPLIPFDGYFSKWNTTVFVDMSKVHKIFTPMQKMKMLSKAFLEDNSTVLSEDLADSLHLTHNYFSNATVTQLRKLVRNLYSTSPLGMYAMEKRMEDVTELTPGDLKSTLEPRYLVPSTVALINQSFILPILCEFEELKEQPMFTTCVALKKKLVTFYQELYSETTMTELQLMKKLSTADIEYLPLGVIAALGPAALDGASTDMKIMLTSKMAARDYSFSIPRHIRSRIVSNGLLAMNYSNTTGLTVNNVHFLGHYALADISNTKLWSTTDIAAITLLLQSFETVLKQSSMFCADNEQIAALAELLKRVKGNNPVNWKHVARYCCILMMLKPEELELIKPKVLSQCYCPSHSGGMSLHYMDMFTSSCNAISDEHHTLLNARENLVTAHKNAIKKIMIELQQTPTRRRRNTDHTDGITTRHEKRQLSLCDEADLFGGNALENLHDDDVNGVSSKRCIRALGSMPIHGNAITHLNGIINEIFPTQMTYQNILEVNYGQGTIPVSSMKTKFPPINNIPLMEALGRAGRLNDEQLAYLGIEMLSDSNSLNKFTSQQILAAGDLMCGIDVNSYKKIGNDEFRETVWALGQLDCLTDESRRALAKKAVQAFGDITLWAQGKVAQSNSIIGGMDHNDIAKMSVGGAAGVTPSAIEVMSEDTLSALLEDVPRLENIPLPTLQALTHDQLDGLTDSLETRVRDRLALAGEAINDIKTTCSIIRQDGMSAITPAQVTAMTPAELMYCLHWIGENDNFATSVLRIIAEKITTDGLTKLSKLQVADMGYVIRGFTTTELTKFPIINDLEYLEVLGSYWNLSLEQIVALAEKMLTDYKKSSELTGADLTAVNNIICGLGESYIYAINDEAFAEALPTISSLATCTNEKMNLLLNKAMVPIGNYSNLDETHVKNFGNLMSGIQPQDLMVIPPEAFLGLTRKAATMMSQGQVTVFTPAQIRCLKKDTASALTPAQIELFSVPQKNALDTVLGNTITPKSAANRHHGDLQFTGVMAVFIILISYNKFAVNLF